MRRRLVAAALCAGLLSAARGHAQPLPSGLRRVGILALNGPQTAPHQWAAFREGMQARGWIEGRNVALEFRWADGRADRLPALAADLVAIDVEVIVTTSSVTTRAAQAATRTIPIVMASSADAVGERLVASLARPGGHTTGMTLWAGPEIVAKQLELLKEAVPAAAVVAVLANPANAAHPAYLQVLRSASGTLKLELQLVEARSPDRLEAAFEAIGRARAAALIVLTDGMFFGRFRQIVDLAARQRLAAIYSQREFVEAGGFAAYGPSLSDMFRRSAGVVDKVLRGADPATIPVEQPSRFELVINLKAARSLGLSVARTLLLRADEVID
jgi:putative ABC transport system substrate-binding protein